MPGRKYQAGTTSYRYAFNGQEKSTEINDASTTAEFWEYDSRIGRRWNIDPKPTIGVSSYATFFNNPILRFDILGDTASPHEAAQMSNDSYNRFSARKKIDGSWARLNSQQAKALGVTLENKGNGFQSAMYSRTVNGKTEYAFAMAGTQNLKDIAHDGTQSIGLSSQYKFAITQAINLSNFLSKSTEMTFIGHSLGGGEAAASSMATGRSAITFNAAGVSILTKKVNGLLGRSDEKIMAFRIPGEIVGPLQGLVGSSADGKIINIHPVFGKLGNVTAKMVEQMTTIFMGVRLHLMGSVYDALQKSGYGQGGDGPVVDPPKPLPERHLPQDADNTINRQLPRYY